MMNRHVPSSCLSYDSITPKTGCAPNFDGEIRTYKEPGKSEKYNIEVMLGNEKTPVPQGQTGVNEHGTRSGIRTQDLLIKRAPDETHNANNDNKLGVHENPMYTLSSDTPLGMDPGVSIKRRPLGESGDHKIPREISESISVPKSAGFSPLAPQVTAGGPGVPGVSSNDAVDLASIMMAWPTIPPAIKAAVKAVLAPYV
jgi:hypothetical protein